MGTGVSISKVLQPKVLQPKVLQPKVLQPKVLQPKVLQPKVLQPKVLQPKVLQHNILQSKEITYNIKLNIDIILISKKIEQLINTDHTKNEHINEILKLMLQEENITNPYGNKNIPDNLREYATITYEGIKNEYVQIINEDIDLLLQTTINDLNKIIVLLKIDINEEINVQNAYIKLNRSIHEKIINNIIYYGKYLTTIIHNIHGIKELCYLGINNVYVYGSNTIISHDCVTINIISTTMLKKIAPYTYNSLLKVLKKLMGEKIIMFLNNYNIFIENIKTIEIVKKKIVFLNKYETKPIQKINYINNDLINKLYEEYLENKFNVMIIDEDNKYEVGLEYKDI